ncbi:hypothetical protein PTKIN_Ptkin12aG0052400 [Pterospermum kingtungense]
MEPIWDRIRYGSVYKGKMVDGRLVAVKVLTESKGNGEDFINEVASIGRTSHVKVVTLLGFCYDRESKSSIEWKTLYDIALGIARGLEYLHQGCNTRILHFDIKPHNIAPKVFSRSFGVVSYKFDVYSYGIMVLEMVDGRKNIETEVSQYSEIYVLIRL